MGFDRLKQRKRPLIEPVEIKNPTFENATR